LRTDPSGRWTVVLCRSQQSSCECKASAVLMGDQKAGRYAKSRFKPRRKQDRYSISARSEELLEWMTRYASGFERSPPSDLPDRNRGGAASD
jgi:hypothetical protein